MNELKILLVVYKIQRGLGSEDGCGYTIAKAMKRLGHKITLITRKNNAALLRDDPEFVDVRIIGVDVPRWLSFYKRRGRGIILYYYIWQILVGRIVRHLNRSEQFDVIHQLNFHCDWAPHFLTNPNGKLVWGPIAHHERVPFDFLQCKRYSSFLREWIREMAKRAFWRLDPFLHWAAARTDVIFYGNANLAPPFRSCKAKVVLRPQASSVPELLADPVRPLTFKILSVGRFIPLKNFDATLDGFAAFLLRNRECGAQLTLIGSGTLEPHLRERACELGIDCNVAFVRWGKQSDLAEHYRTSAVFVFPSFESQGLVVAEAMGAGAPVICMENSGPSFLAGSTGAVVTRRDYQSTVSEIADRLEQLYQEWADDTKSFRFTSRMQRVRREYDRRLDTDALVDAIDAAYHG